MKTLVHVMLPAFTLLAAGSVLTGEETRIKRSELPPAVEKAVAEQAKVGTLRGLSKEIEHGKTFYEAELTINGHGRDVLIDEAGQVVEVEEEIAFDALPASVKEGLRSSTVGGEIVKVETLMKYGELVAYEAAVKTNGKRTEIKVGPDGKKLPK